MEYTAVVSFDDLITNPPKLGDERWMQIFGRPNLPAKSTYFRDMFLKKAMEEGVPIIYWDTEYTGKK
jgi:hypothetical protein